MSGTSEPIFTARPGTRDLLSRVDTVIFDMDGVLIDFTESIRPVNLLSIPTYLRTLPGWTAPDDLVTSEDIEQFKRAGGFNDDWDLTYAAVLLFLARSVLWDSRDASLLAHRAPTIAEFTSAIAARGGWLSAAEAIIFESLDAGQAGIVRSLWKQEEIRRIFQELYAGDLAPRLYGFTPTINKGRGYVRNDRSLVDPSLLPADRTLAALTGRTWEEAELGLELTGLRERIPLETHAVTKRDELYKPEPEGMRRLLRRLNSRVAVYVGDSPDDLRTVLNFRRLPEAREITLLSVQVLTGPAGAASAPLFSEADLIAPDVNAFLGALPPRGA